VKKRKRKITKKNRKRKCYFCGTTNNLTEHHIIFKIVISVFKKLFGVKIPTKKEYLCEECHRKFHYLAYPVIDLLLSATKQLAEAILKLQPHKMEPIGYIRTNGRRKKK